MRIIHICAALSGVFALVLLAATHHLRASEYYSFALLAGIAQLSAAATGLAIANRQDSKLGRLNAIAAALILGGAFLFAGEIFLSFFWEAHPLHFLAPIGGATLIIGWIALAFARPS
jgi:uncharacterized membrane protein YgdD (TMEM256/DUF423 family)